ncbi:MAG: hypothetical protein K6T86_04840 [Pirellulales bacterium]|nr:hypothetical protein [Pirellulales bacterium]
MDRGAHVHALSALAELRAALLTFEAEARDALCQVDLEIRRFLDWLGHDLVKGWQAEIRRREDLVAHAKADLERARLSAAFGDEPDCTDQKIALARAKRRLEEAEELLRVTRRWLPAAEKEAADYRGPTQQLVNFLDADIPAAAARIERMLAALEGYLAQTPPQAAELSARNMASSERASSMPAAGMPPASRAASGRAARGEAASSVPEPGQRGAAEAESPEAISAEATSAGAISAEQLSTQGVSKAAESEECLAPHAASRDAAAGGSAEGTVETPSQRSPVAGAGP